LAHAVNNLLLLARKPGHNTSHKRSAAIAGGTLLADRVIIVFYAWHVLLGVPYRHYPLQRAPGSPRRSWYTGITGSTSLLSGTGPALSSTSPHNEPVGLRLTFRQDPGSGEPHRCRDNGDSGSVISLRTL